MSDFLFDLQFSSASFSRITGLAFDKFNKLAPRVEKEFWEIDYKDKNKRERKRIVGGGKKFDFTVLEMMLIALLYFCTYMTMEFIGFLIGKKKGTVCKIIHRIKFSLLKVLKIKPLERQLRQGREIDSIESLQTLIDATEQEIQRPSKKQKYYYSGKKKKHTIKTQIAVSTKGEILDVSKSVNGKQHDFRLFKESNILKLPSKIKIYGDSGYQGIEEFHANSQIPIKASKKHPLSKIEKRQNHKTSKTRIRVENVFNEMKRFRILSGRYRNRRRNYSYFFKIIAGLVNLKNGFLKFD
jgi:hypothetical protein